MKSKKDLAGNIEINPIHGTLAPLTLGNSIFHQGAIRCEWSPMLLPNSLITKVHYVLKSWLAQCDGFTFDVES